MLAWMPVLLTIDGRFCGPPGMGNGGYVCGRLAAFVPSPTAARAGRAVWFVV
jgi:hypothetical protein